MDQTSTSPFVAWVAFVLAGFTILALALGVLRIDLFTWL